MTIAQRSDNPVPASVDDPAPTRRCWRCLQMFACPQHDVAAGKTEWWLCEACHVALIETR